MQSSGRSFGDGVLKGIHNFLRYPGWEQVSVGQPMDACQPWQLGVIGGEQCVDNKGENKEPRSVL